MIRIIVAVTLCKEKLLLVCAILMFLKGKVYVFAYLFQLF